MNSSVHLKLKIDIAYQLDEYNKKLRIGRVG